MTRMITVKPDERYGRLLVLKRLPRLPTRTGALWLCLCDCGKETKAESYKLTSRGKASCGCGVTAATAARSTKHGLRHDPIYTAWINMRGRCENQNRPDYHYYGGRGITICPRWLSKDGFANFVTDMAPRPEGGTLERIDVNGPYSRENCCWASRKQQGNNKRNNVRLTWAGETMTVPEWAALRGIFPFTIHARLRSYGWTVGEALGFEPPPIKKGQASGGGASTLAASGQPATGSIASSVSASGAAMASSTIDQ